MKQNNNHRIDTMIIQWGITIVNHMHTTMMQEHRQLSKCGGNACVFKHMTYKLDNSF
jgi:hypothetical protein